MKLHSQAVRLEPVPPFDFGQTLAFIARARAFSSEGEVEGGTLTKALRVRGETVAFRLRSAGTVDAPELRGTLYALRPLTPDLVTAACSAVRHFLGVDDDLRPFYALAAPDDAFAPVVERFYGYHQVRFPSPFEGACWAVVTQRTPNAFAYKTRQRLIDALGSGLELEGKGYGAFPDALQLLKADPKAVLTATNNLRKLERLRDVARAFAEADERFLRHGPSGEVVRWLKAIKGIGDWSVDFIMMRALGRMDRTPWTDTGLLEAVGDVYAGGLSLERGHVKRIADLYGEHQGYWVHYLKRARWG